MLNLYGASEMYYVKYEVIKEDCKDKNGEWNIVQVVYIV